MFDLWPVFNPDDPMRRNAYSAGRGVLVVVDRGQAGCSWIVRSRLLEKREGVPPTSTTLSEPVIQAGLTHRASNGSGPS
jgi:hypothetical protein